MEKIGLHSSAQFSGCDSRIRYNNLNAVISVSSTQRFKEKTALSHFWHKDSTRSRNLTIAPKETQLEPAQNLGCAVDISGRKTIPVRLSDYLVNEDVRKQSGQYEGCRKNLMDKGEKRPASLANESRSSSSKDKRSEGEMIDSAQISIGSPNLSTCVAAVTNQKCSSAFRESNLEILPNSPTPNDSILEGSCAESLLESEKDDPKSVNCDYGQSVLIVGTMTIDLRGVNYDSSFVLTVGLMAIVTRVCDPRVPTVGTMAVSTIAVDSDIPVLDTYRNKGETNRTRVTGLGWFFLEGEINVILGIPGIPEQCQAGQAEETALKLDLDGFVVIGGDVSNTNDSLLAEHFGGKNMQTQACKIYAEIIGNVMVDARSTGRYYHFMGLMGHVASCITLECAMQMHPDITVIGEEVALKKQTLKNVIDVICKCADHNYNYGEIFIPEGLIDYIPKVQQLIAELNEILAHELQPQS
eukprot:Gb_17314 [translate_table: standard]